MAKRLETTRRRFLGQTALGAGALLVGVACGAGAVPELDGGMLPLPTGDAGAEPDAGEMLDAGVQENDAGTDAGIEADAGVTPSCEETEDNILGPFYRPGAPMRDVLADASDGEVLIISGLVSGLSRAGACVPLEGALLDVWQADADGAYDNTSAAFRFRGQLRTGAQGFYELQTILPGRYLNGPEFRPRHIHFRISAPGHRLLTTQLYFADDPFLASDPFVHPKLVVPLQPAFDADHRAYWDIVLGAV